LNNPTTWNWTFSNGTPSTSTLQNPIVTFNSAGTYNDIKLTVTNANGIDSVIKYSYISISPQITPVIELLGTNTICSGTSVQMRSSNSNTYLWSPNGQTSFQINANTSGVFYVTTKDIYGCTTTSAPVSVFVVPPPVTPTVTIVGDTLYSSAPTGNQWYINNVLVPGATQQQFVMTVLNAIYKVVVTDSITGCSAASGVLLGIQNFDDNTVQLSAFPNPAKANTLLTFNSEENNKTTIKLMDELGKVVYEKNFNAVKGQNELIVETSIYEVGLYFLSVSQSNGNAVIKLIIEK
jgi:PKD repeat protein